MRFPIWTWLTGLVAEYSPGTVGRGPGRGAGGSRVDRRGGVVRTESTSDPGPHGSQGGMISTTRFDRRFAASGLQGIDLLRRCRRGDSRWARIVARQGPHPTSSPPGLTPQPAPPRRVQCTAAPTWRRGQQSDEGQSEQQGTATAFHAPTLPGRRGRVNGQQSSVCAPAQCNLFAALAQGFRKGMLSRPCQPSPRGRADDGPRKHGTLLPLPPLVVPRFSLSWTPPRGASARRRGSLAGGRQSPR